MGTSLTIDDTLRNYIRQFGAREHPVMQKCREETAALGDISIMQIAPEQAAFLAMLIRLTGAKRCLEVGVFTGYSALAVALALPHDGHILALEKDEKFARQAQGYWSEAGIDHKVELRLGPAQDTLNKMMADNRTQPYDFAFIDADKRGYDAYYESALNLLRPGGLVALDNMLWSGRVADMEDHSEMTKSIRMLNEKIAADDRVDICLAPVGDGLFLCRKR